MIDIKRGQCQLLGLLEVKLMGIRASTAISHHQSKPVSLKIKIKG